MSLILAAAMVLHTIFVGDVSGRTWVRRCVERYGSSCGDMLSVPYVLVIEMYKAIDLSSLLLDTSA